jgi:hypothetical protein
VGKIETIQAYSNNNGQHIDITKSNCHQLTQTKPNKKKRNKKKPQVQVQTQEPNP